MMPTFARGLYPLMILPFSGPFHPTGGTLLLPLERAVGLALQGWGARADALW